jgi:hypothetical protein
MKSQILETVAALKRRYFGSGASSVALVEEYGFSVTETL